MATMNISLPDQMKAWVEEQVKSGRYANSSDYMRDLVRAEQRRWAAGKLQAIVDDALASGISDLSWDELKAHARSRAEAPAKKAQVGV